MTTIQPPHLQIIFTDSFPQEIQADFIKVANDELEIIQKLFPGIPPAGLKPIYCRIWWGATPLTQTYPSHYLISLKTEPVNRYYDHFVYQLAHELGHVMLGSKRTNGMVETLATLISHQVLDEMAVKWEVAPPYDHWKSYAPNFIRYRENVERKHLANFMPRVQEMVSTKDWQALSDYMKIRREDQDNYMCDRDLNCLGTILLRTIDISWQQLKGLAWLTDPTPDEYSNYREDLEIIVEKVPTGILPLFQILGRA